GVFLTFSDFVMRSLAATEPAGGIEAMQQINRKVFRTLFMVLLIGMAIVSPLMAAVTVLQGSGPATTWIIAAAVTYVVGTFGVTVVFNVPMNERLDRMAHDSAVAAAYWHRYVPAWSFWNSIRTLASVASAVFMLMAVVELA
ncbi:MAG: DUF1772 domain-containing protein, partial [Hyphomonas sp.]|nr:DUF1772 domain-containing protein [Hyphomonas sp.]